MAAETKVHKIGLQLQSDSHPSLRTPILELEDGSLTISPNRVVVQIREGGKCFTISLVSILRGCKL
jgi:hypothetical protein